MEYYGLTVIPTDSQFVPKPLQIEKFFEILTKDHQFRIISDKPFQPGLRVTNAAGRLRTVKNPMTGETLLVDVSDQIKLDSILEVSSAIEGLEHYSVLASGEWTREGLPVCLLTTDELPFEGRHFWGSVSCSIRPGPISTSCWDPEMSPNSLNVSNFGEPCETKSKNAIFSHPWTGKPVEVPDAGCARFWIEFEFGKFLLPKMEESLDILAPTMLTTVENCFGIRFAQGWQFN